MTVRRIVTVVAIALAALVGISAVALAGARLVHRGEIIPGVQVAGVDVGGMDADQARQALAPIAAAREADPVTLTTPESSFTLDPTDVSYAVDLDATIERAMSVGRGDGLGSETWDHLSAYWTDRRSPVIESFDSEALDALIEDVVTEVERDPFPGSVSADPETLEVTSRPPADGAHVLVDETREAVLEAFKSAGPEEVELPLEVLPARIEAAEVEAAAAQARAALAGPLTLTSPARNVTLSPRQLAPLVSLAERQEGDAWTVELVADSEQVESLFGDIAGSFEVEPTDARFDVPRTPPTTFDDKDDATWSPRPADVPIIPSSKGLTFDPDLAAGQLSELLRQGARSAELRLAEVDPAFSTEDARELGIDEVLSTFTSYHACCQTRVQNIQRLADMVDGTVVEPGEQFSINQISGERTCGKGFAPAGMILRGEIVDVCGGGVSQFGTTTINAIFFAGIEPDAYKPHSFYISRYPMAREATLNYPSPDIDVKFTNNTGHGILIRAAYTSQSISVTFYGHNDVDRVSADVGSPYNVKPYPTEFRENKALPPQAQRTIQSGKNGFSVKLTRTITFEDGTTETDDWSNVYVPEREIIERNSDPKPEPEPEPSPSPEPTPSPSPSSSPKPKPSPSDGGGDSGQAAKPSDRSSGSAGDDQ